MSKSVSIAQPLETPDWNQLRSLAPEPAAALLSVILRALDRIEEQAFAVRGEAMLLIEERNLFRFVLDEEVGDYYQSFDKWLKDTLPRSWGYCRDALRTRKECREIPYADYVQIPRCNSEQLKLASSSVRVLPEVIEAAKTETAKELRRKLNTDHGQHLESSETLKLTYPAGDMASVKTYLGWVAGKAELEPDDYPGALLYLAIHENQERDAE
jgi:hypothetical protein